MHQPQNLQMVISTVAAGAKTGVVAALSGGCGPRGVVIVLEWLSRQGQGRGESVADVRSDLSNLDLSPHTVVLHQMCSLVVWPIDPWGIVYH